MPDILIGTSGFHYDDWKGVFYPRETGTKDYLDYYARHFKILELNFTYYRIPQARQSSQMIEKTRGMVQFIVKAYRQMTHEIPENAISDVTPLFLEGISPFIREGLLGSVLLQFPQGFRYVPDNRRYLKALIDSLAPLPVSVEFRHRDWLKESVYDTLRRSGAGFVCIYDNRRDQ